MAQAPQASDESATGFNSAIVLERLDDAERDIKSAVRDIKDVQSSNRFIIIILFVGFITLVITTAIFVVTITISDSNSRSELAQQVKDLNSKIPSTGK